jgi:hypothetical protein
MLQIIRKVLGNPADKTKLQLVFANRNPQVTHSTHYILCVTMMTLSGIGVGVGFGDISDRISYYAMKLMH